MRYLPAALVAATATAALLAPSSALAQIESLSISQARLGAEGADVVVTMTYQCQTDYNVAFGDATVTQSRGNKLVQGSGSFVNDFPGVPCTGSPETREVVVTTFGSIPYKQGKAAVSANLSVFNPTTGTLTSESSGPLEIRITHK